MSPQILGVDCAGIMHSVFGPRFLDATLVKKTAGTRTPGNLAGGSQPTSASYAAKGVILDYADSQIDGTIIQRGDRKVLLLGASIASAQVPTAADQVTIESVTYQVVKATRDPAGATYELQCRK